MTGRLRGYAVGAVLVAAWLVLLALVASSTGVFRQVDRRVEAAKQAAPKHHRLDLKRERAGRDPSSGLGRSLDRAGGEAWRAIRLPLLLLIVAASASVASRTVCRRRRLGAIRRF